MTERNVLQIIPAENSRALLTSLAAWRNNFPAPGFRFHIALLPTRLFQPHDLKTIDGEIPFYRLPPPWKTGLLHLIHLVRHLEIDVIHTFGRAVATSCFAARAFMARPAWVHQHIGDEALRVDFFLRLCNRIAVTDAAIGDQLRRLGGFSQTDFFANPLSVDFANFRRDYRPSGLGTSKRIVVQSMDRAVRRLPPALRLTGRALKNAFPDLKWVFRQPAGSFDFRQDNDAPLFTVLLPGEVSAETFLLALTNLVRERAPFIVASSDFRAPFPFVNAEFWTAPLDPYGLEKSLGKALREPEALLGVASHLQDLWNEHLPFARFCQNWNLEYETVLETHSLKRPIRQRPENPPGRTRAAAIAAADFLALLRCPECRRSLSPAPESDRIVCERGHAFAVVEGIPRLFRSDHSQSARQASPRLEHRLSRRLRRMLAPILRDLKPGERMLYIGAHSTAELFEPIRYGSQVIAVLEDCQRSPALSISLRDFPQLKILEATTEYLPLSEASFDVVIHSEANLDHPDPVRYLSGLRRLLRRGGRLQIFTVDAAGLSPEMHAALRRMPHTLAAGLSGFLAFRERWRAVFSSAPSASWRELYRARLRLLDSAEVTVVGERTLRRWAEECGVNNARIDRIRPFGLALSGTVR